MLNKSVTEGFWALVASQHPKRIPPDSRVVYEKADAQTHRPTVIVQGVFQGPSGAYTAIEVRFSDQDEKLHLEETHYVCDARTLEEIPFITDPALQNAAA